MQLTPVIGVTIATTGYESLAQEAARRFRFFTGLPCIIITADGRDGYDLKFEIVKIAGGRVVFFFDADWFMIRPTPLNQFIGMEGLAAVVDPAGTHESNQFPMQDAAALGFPGSRYVNTGCMVFNSADSRVVRAFDRASVLMAEKRAGLHADVTDTTEQSLLCLALFENGLPTQFLPLRWNCYYYSVPAGLITSIPADIVAVHAAGVPLERKMEWLQIQVKAWEIYH